jgi:hypothetical protein
VSQCLAIPATMPCSPTYSKPQQSQAVELGRFVLLNSVPGNGETWFLARCFDLLKNCSDLVGVLSFSDPLPRRTIGGAVIMPGHVGTIYQAHNGRYLGLSTPRTMLLLPDGSVLSARAVQKIRARESGWKYASALLERFGAAPLMGDPTTWLAIWLPRLTRRVRHPGAHKYAWPFHRSVEKILPSPLAYPKLQPLFVVTSEQTHQSVPTRLFENGLGSPAGEQLINEYARYY